ncbi:MAG: glycosyltransferase family 2 protein [Paludibacter sp.]
MKISIITATYNSEKSLQRTINSVVSQDYGNIEHIIIDGGSTDSTLAIIKSNLNSIDKYISERDNGIYSALNAGIKLATGDIIGFLHSDDIFNDEFVVSKIISTFQLENCDVLYGNLIYQSKNSNNPKTIRYWKSNSFKPIGLKYGWMPPHPTVYCKKTVYDQYGNFNEKFKISADYDFILRIFKETIIQKSYLPSIMVKMDVGGVSNGSLKGILRKSKEDYQSIRQNKVGGFYTILCKNLRKIFQFSKFRTSKTS